MRLFDIGDKLLRDAAVNVERLFRRALLFRLVKGNKPTKKRPPMKIDAVKVRCDTCGKTFAFFWPTTAIDGPCGECGGELMIVAFGEKKPQPHRA